MGRAKRDTTFNDFIINRDEITNPTFFCTTLWYGH